MLRKPRCDISVRGLLIFFGGSRSNVRYHCDHSDLALDFKMVAKSLRVLT